MCEVSGWLVCAWCLAVLVGRCVLTCKPQSKSNRRRSRRERAEAKLHLRALVFLTAFMPGIASSVPPCSSKADVGALTTVFGAAESVSSNMPATLRETTLGHSRPDAESPVPKRARHGVQFYRYPFLLPGKAGFVHRMRLRRRRGHPRKRAGRRRQPPHQKKLRRRPQRAQKPADDQPQLVQTVTDPRICEIPGDGWCCFRAVSLCEDLPVTPSKIESSLSGAQLCYLKALEVLWNLPERALCVAESDSEADRHRRFWRQQGLQGDLREEELVIASKVAAVALGEEVLDSMHHGSMIDLWGFCTGFDIDVIVWRPADNTYYCARSQELLTQE